MSRELLETPLHAWHAGAGANMTDFGGWDMPLWYSTGAIAEHKAVVTDAGMFDTSHMAALTLDGDNAFELLQKCFTKDLTRCTGLKKTPLTPGRCVYGAFLDEGGFCIDDAIVYQIADGKFMVVVNAGMGGKIAEHLGKYSSGGVNIVDWTGKLGKMDVQGPKAGKIMAKVLADPEKIFDKLPYFSFKGHFDPASEYATVVLKDGTKILLSRTGYTGEFGFEIFVQQDKLASVWESILEAGREYNLIPCGLASRDSLRAGSVLPLSHQDIGGWTYINHPWSFALPYNDDMSDFTKEFVGYGVLKKSETEDHTLTYVGKDPRKVPAHADVFNEEGERIGEVLTCVADMAVGRVDDKIYSLSSPDLPDGFKAKGLVCGFIKVSSKLDPGTIVELRDNKRKIKVEITDDVRPNRTARRPIKEMI